VSIHFSSFFGRPREKNELTPNFPMTPFPDVPRRVAPRMMDEGDGSAWTLLPKANHVAGGITDRRHPQGSFGVGRLDDLATVNHHSLHGIIDVINVHVW
jgi:hypothetical protein